MSQFGTGASCCVVVVAVVVVVVVAVLPLHQLCYFILSIAKAICDAPVKLSRASAPRSDWAEIVKDRMSNL